MNDVVGNVDDVFVDFDEVVVAVTVACDVSPYHLRAHRLYVVVDVKSEDDVGVVDVAVDAAVDFDVFACGD